MRARALVVAIPLLVVVVVGFNVLIVVYAIDLTFSGCILLVVFLLPILVMLLYWAAMMAYAPLSLATADDASERQSAAGLLLMPVGLGLAFLLWQAQNWFIYGLLDSEPRLYNWIFERIGIGI
jgi:hypothetical protein